MPLEIVRNDITKMSVDAIVNAANTTLLGGGGVDGAIHRAAGPQLLEECRTLHGCRTGEAKITQGYRLPCRYVIHTAGPVWQDGHHGERELLTACYKNSLELADQYHCESVAFPLISSGVYGYPKAQALKVAIDTITQFLLDHDMTVYIVVFSKDAFEVSSKLFKDIEAYIDDVYVDERLSAPSESMRMRLQRRYLEKAKATEAEPEECCAPSMASDACLDDMLRQVDESFAQMLIRKIDEKHMTDAQCYISKLFKDETGQNFAAYVRQHRIAWVQRELSDTDRPVKDIVLDSGYMDVANFSRSFKAYSGVTPVEYRRQSQARRAKELHTRSEE